MTEKKLSRKDVFQGHLIDVHVDEVLLLSGKTAAREIVEHKGAACIVVVTAENEVLFIKQFRYPFNKILLELPAGKLEADESPLECAKRELTEETGAIGENFISLGEMYPTVGYCSEIIHLYACAVKDYQAPAPDEDEFLEIVKIPLNEAVRMVLNNEIPDAKTQIGILKLNNLL
jgi:ADP-ribose pyrophosphatase